MENCKENKGRNNRIHNVLWLGIRKEMPLVILILIVIFWQLGVFNVEKDLLEESALNLVEKLVQACAVNHQKIFRICV